MELLFTYGRGIDSQRMSNLIGRNRLGKPLLSPHPAIVEGYIAEFSYNLHHFKETKDWGVPPNRNSLIAIQKPGKLIGVVYEVTPEELEEYDKQEYAGKVYKWEQVRARSFTNPNQPIGTAHMLVASEPQAINHSRIPHTGYLIELVDAAYKLGPEFGRSLVENLFFVSDPRSETIKSVAELMSKA